MMHREIPDQPFHQAYREADQQLRLRHARVGCALTLMLMPAGSILDALVYPELLLPFFYLRWATVLAVAIVFVLLLTRHARTCMPWVGSAWAVLAAVAITWMIHVTGDGADSPYYAGLNLVIIGACLLMPYTIREAVAICLGVVAAYSLACLAPGTGLVGSWAVFGNNLFFIVVTSIIAVTSCHYYNLRRVADFRLRYELDQRNHELAELDRLKTQFFANVSHELRTPLTLILAPVDRLLANEPRLDDATRQVLRTVQSNGLRLLKLINDLLDIVQLDAGQPTDDAGQRKINLALYLPGLLESVRGLAQAKHITLHLERHHDDPCIVCGDPARLEKVFLNLLTNAIKFTPAGGTVTARLAATAEHVTVTVEDSGIGIPDDQIPHIFERFRQVDGSSTRPYQGLGLGLALARELVEAHGGRITVRSDPGHGAAFNVTLPRAAAGEGEAVLAEPETYDDPTARLFQRARRQGGAPDLADTQPPAPAPAPRRTAKAGLVLLVDDEPAMRDFLHAMLGDEHRLLHAGDGVTGLAMAQQHQPHVILLDVMMPGMDGLELCRAVRADPSLVDTRIVMLTARGDERSRIEALRAGADDFLTKPFSLLELKTRLANLLDARRLQADLRLRNQDLESTIAELRATRSQLVQSEKMNALGSLAAGLLHEINNPLNYTLMALQLAEQKADELNPSMRETLEDIGEGMRRIRDIVTDLRTFAYPDRLAPNDTVDLAEAVRAAVRLTSHLDAASHIQCHVPAPLQVHGSQSHLTQVLVNLLSNAIRATQPIRDQRTPAISVHAEREDDHVVIRVTDNGTGIEPDKRDRIFEPFFTTGEIGEGMGLGLSICHTIISEHNGSIQIRSEDCQGTTVTVRLPACQGKDVTHAPSR